MFFTASPIPNKNFPRLAELAISARTVLMEATTPWLPQLREFGIRYPADVEVTNAEELYRTLAEGGGEKIFNSVLRYRVVELTPETSIGTG